MPRLYSSSLYVGTLPIVCGGWNSKGAYYDACFRYDTVSKKWSESGWMSAGGKRHAAASVHPELGLVITGGHTGSKVIRAVETTKDGRSFSHNIPDMPTPNHAHCQVTVDKNTIMTFGGCIIGNCNLKNVYKLDTRTKKWSRLPSLPTGRHAPICEVVRERGVPKRIVVAGGWSAGKYINTVEILDLTTLTWKKGSPYPVPAGYMGTVPFGDTFITVGGYQQGVGAISTMYKYEPLSNRWSRLPYRLSTPMYGQGFVLPANRDALEGNYRRK